MRVTPMLPWTAAEQSNPPATSTQPGRAEVVDQIKEVAAIRSGRRRTRLDAALPAGGGLCGGRHLDEVGRVDSEGGQDVDQGRRARQPSLDLWTDEPIPDDR